VECDVEVDGSDVCTGRRAPRVKAANGKCGLCVGEGNMEPFLLSRLLAVQSSMEELVEYSRRE
jgi:hypothetical protein